jgi:hypothetical protein
MNMDKNKILIASVFLFLAPTGSAMAADISGKWIVPSEDVTIEMVFKANGTTCTGTVYNPKMGEVDIKDCRIDGDTINFYVTRLIAQNEYKNAWMGKVSGDKIQFTGTTQQIKRTIATRVRAGSSKEPAPARGVDISGKWIARLQDGAKADIVFITEGNNFTGIIVNPNEADKQIMGGRITGDNISFIAVRDDSRVRWEGTIIGDEIEFIAVLSEDIKRSTAWKVNSNPSAATAPIDLSGKWVGQVPGGGVRFELYFMKEGDTFSGTVVNAQLGEAPMKDGKIEGDAITFTVPRKDSIAQWKGRVVGDELRVTMIGREQTPVQIMFTRIRSSLPPGLLRPVASIDLSGKWTANAPGGVKIEMYFMPKGIDFTGILIHSKDGETAMKGGEIDGKDISFYVIAKKPEGNESRVEWKGKLAGDDIAFTYTVSGDDPRRITVTRARPKPTVEP